MTLTPLQTPGDLVTTEDDTRGQRLKVPSAMWHTLTADMLGDHGESFFDAGKMNDAPDPRFATPRNLDTWMKPDSFTLFDDSSLLTLRPL
ncbi:MAG: hypothetical protein NVS1B4_12310 [Gemmatimonadaceae bacterium]